MNNQQVLGRIGFRRKAARQRAWRFLNVVVAIATLWNVSLLGSLVVPRQAEALSVDTYDQCSNDTGSGYSSGDTGCRWINGNLQGNNSLYAEGDATVQRLWKSDFAPGSNHSITIEYGTTKGGKRAYDFLTSWNWSENWITEDDLCQDIDGCATADASENTWPIPHDSNGSGQFETGVRNFVMRGGQLTGASAPALVSGSYAADSDTALTVNFTVANDGPMCKTKQGTTTCGIALFFGAHIAKTSEWQPHDGTTGATSIPGSPYHVKLAAIDGDASGQRDNQMQAGAIANVVIEKQTLPNGSQQSFGFTSQTADLNGFSLSDGQQKIAALNAGTYTVTESDTPGWSLTDITCVDPSGNSSGNLGTKSATINVVSGETVTCIFTNSESPTLTVTKVVTNNNGGNAQVSDFDLFVDQTPVTSGDINAFAPGDYVVSEATTIPGYTGTISGDCDAQGNVTLASGDHKSCTITNDDIAPTLKLVKNLTTDNGGTSTLASWTLTADDGNSGGFSYTADQSAFQTVKANTAYSLSESGPVGYAAGSWSCDGGSLNGNNITLELAENVTCTITNDDIAPTLRLVKVVSGGSNTADEWTLTADDGNQGGFSDSGDSITFHTIKANTAYALSESGPANYTPGTWSCDGGSLNGNEVTLALDEDVTCEITNTRDTGTLTLVKEWVGFPFLTILQAGTNPGGSDVISYPVILSNGSIGPVTVDTDTYYVSEDMNLLFNYDSFLSCTKNGNAYQYGPNQSVTVEKNDDVVCTFSNREIPTLTVTKIVNNDDGGTATVSHFDLYVGASLVSSGIANSFAPGDYVVSEILNVTGYAQTSIGGDCDAGGNVTLNYGDHKDCTITNDDIAPTLRLVKVVSGGSNTADEWTLTADDGNQGGFSDSGDSITFHTIKANTAYALSESGPANYTPGTWSCDGGSLNGNEVTLALDEDVTCEITNTRDTGSIIVHKLVDTNGDGTFDGDNTVANNIGFAWGIGAATPTRTMGSSATVDTGNYTVSENSVSGYHFVGWAFGNPAQFDGNICDDTNATLPVNVSVANSETADVTFCNRVNVTTIALDKTGPATTTPGAQFSYTLAWSVNGNTDATDAVITDPIPANTTYVSNTCGTTTGTCVFSMNGGTATWDLGTRSPGASGTVTLTVQASAGLTEPVTLTNTGTFDTDQTLPVSDTVQTRVSIVLGDSAEPEIALAKAVEPGTTNPGKTVVYTLIVTNTGDADAVNVIVTDTLPDGFTYADTGRTTRTWTFPTLAAGASETIHFDVKVGADVVGGDYVNTAFALADGLDPVSAQAKVTIKIPAVLGLATTGIGFRDYLLFMTGFGLLAAGYILIQRYRLVK